MESEEVCLKWNNFSSNITKNIDELWKNDNYVDVTIYSEGKFIQAHKIILSASSATFKNIFDFNPCKHPVVILQDVKYRELNALITFIYKGEVNIDQQNLPDLLKAAQTLQICGLFDSMTKSYNNEKETNLEKPTKKRKLESESNIINDHLISHSNAATTSIQENKISNLETTNDEHNLKNNEFNTEVFIKTEYPHDDDDDNEEHSVFLPSLRVEVEEETSTKPSQAINDFDTMNFSSSSNIGPPREFPYMESSENKQFRETLVENLIVEARGNIISLTPNEERPAAGSTQLSRLEVKYSQHWPSKCNPRRCRVCSKNNKYARPSYCCKKCNVGLCVADCFEKWHTHEKF